MSLKSSILKQATKDSIGAGLRKSFLESAIRTLPSDGLAGTNRALIQDALGESGAIPKTTFSSRLGKMSDDSVNDALVIMARDSPAEFDVLMRNMYADDTGGRAALKKFYKENPSIQSNIKKALPDDTAFFKGIDELTPAQRKAATKEMAEPHFNKADGGRAWFGKVWDSMTVKNLESATGAAKNIGWLSLTVGVAWTVMSVIGFLTGKDMVEIFSDFFEFVKNPAGALFDGETGDWELTTLGKSVFGLTAIFGIAAAVKLIKTLTPSEA